MCTNVYLFILFLLAIMLSVLQISNADYPYGIFKLVLLITLRYRQISTADYPYDVFKLVLLITPTISSN